MLGDQPTRGSDRPDGDFARPRANDPPPTGAIGPKTSIDDLNLAVLDVETTGLDPWQGDRICEIAIVRAEGAFEVARYSTLVNPLREVSPGAYAVNRISAQMLAGAPTFGDIASEVAELLGGAVFVAHNARFDTGFVARELALAGWRVPETPILDTLELARRKFHFGHNNLAAVARALGVSSPDHRALADALVTLGVLRQMLKQFCPGGARLSDVVRAQGGPIGWPTSPADSPLPVELAEALRAGQSLLLRYADYDGVETDRWVDPIQLVQERGQVSIVGYCHLRRERRTFRVDRIRRWEIGLTPTDPMAGPEGG